MPRLNFWRTPLDEGKHQPSHLPTRTGPVSDAGPQAIARVLEEEIARLKTGLQLYTHTRYPRQYAETQHNLGNAYQQRIEGERRSNLEAAITCYREALRVLTIEAFPKQCAETQHNLGLAYADRIEGERRANLETAIACYREALRVYTIEAFPVDYAMTQHNLGHAYQQRIAGDRRANLETAIACCREALRVYTFKDFPKQYAETQDNLGGAYQQRIAGERRANLETAIACCREALRVHTFKDFPVDYAMTQNNLGLAYADRIEGERRANLETAIACCREALRVRTFKDFPVDYAMTQHNLGNAYQQRIEGERRANLEEAITCYREALRVLTIEAFPEQYATTRNNLGLAYADRIAGERRANLEEAIACYREALRVYTFEAFPKQYATTQHNLGLAYADRIAGERRANLETAIACYREALRVHTFEAFPHDHRWTQLNRAFVESERQNWVGMHDAYSSALTAEDLLVALGAGIAGRDAVLKEGREAAARDGFALTRLARIPEAAVVIERGRARGLAEALALDAADPEQIRNTERRERYTAARQTFIAAQTTLNDPRLLVLAENEQRRINLERTEAFHRAWAAFDNVVREIRAAQDPADFLETALDPLTILRAAERAGLGHALVYLTATPWGGVAVAALSANPNLGTPTRFAMLDLPHLSDALVSDLIDTHLSDDAQHITGGFAYAQEHNGFVLMLENWPGATLRERAMALQQACVAAGKTSTLAEAAQAVAANPRLAHFADQSLDTLNDPDRERLTSTLAHLFLQSELRRCLETLAKVALRPLVAWLREQGVTSLTFIPCGWLTAFPLSAAPLADGRTVGEALPTSIAPSARSLLHNERSVATRAGVYTLGNPRPTHQELKWGEAEAHTLASLAVRLGQPAEARVHEEATRDWLIQALYQGRVVDASCHGDFNISEPLQSALFLAVRERLTLGDMLSHVADLRGLRLLILSACQTAIVDLRGAKDEVHSLAAGMVQAGAQAVLAAQWAVDDKATYLLMVRFAQEWLPHQESEPPAATLARAQRWLRTVKNGELQTWRASDLPTLTVEVSRYGMGEAELRVQAGGRNAPDACPYADPIFWAGFQITGW
jgi:CHAT domain-containing protein/tetratricopeptide (TPR) repeat protein